MFLKCLYILAVGVFGILNTEMGYIGILTNLANYFDVSVSTAGLLVSLFALAITIAGPTLPLVLWNNRLLQTIELLTLLKNKRTNSA